MSELNPYELMTESEKSYSRERIENHALAALEGRAAARVLKERGDERAERYEEHWNDWLAVVNREIDMLARSEGRDNDPVEEYSFDALEEYAEFKSYLEQLAETDVLGTREIARKPGL